MNKLHPPEELVRLDKSGRLYFLMRDGSLRKAIRLSGTEFTYRGAPQGWTGFVEDKGNPHNQG